MPPCQLNWEMCRDIPTHQPKDQSGNVSSTHPREMPGRIKRAAGIAVLAGLGIAAGVGAGIGGLGLSASTYYKLSERLNTDMEKVADSLATIQQQINSLAGVTLQNRRALDILTAEKGGTCVLLGEECCYFVNQSGVVTQKMRELRESMQQSRKEIAGIGD